MGYPWPANVLIDHPVFAGVFGAAVAVACVFGFRYAYQDYQSYPEAPLRLDVAQACSEVERNGQLYVELTDARFACDRPRSSDKELLLTDAAQAHEILARYDSAVRCEYVSKQPAVGLLFSPAEEGGNASGNVKVLCTYCGRGNSGLGMILCGVFGVLGLLLYPIARHAHRQLYGE